MQNGKPQARPASQPIDWRRVVSAACLKCDWSTLARTALGSPELAAMVGEAFRVIGTTIERDIARADAEAAAAPRATVPPPPPAEPIAAHEDAEPCDATEPPHVEAEETPAVVVDEKTANAASLLGVDVTASEDEIRAALRARLSSSKLHPDHGGDGEEAKQLIGAKNLLIERARTRR